MRRLGKRWLPQAEAGPPLVRHPAYTDLREAEPSASPEPRPRVPARKYTDVRIKYTTPEKGQQPGWIVTS